MAGLRPWWGRVLLRGWVGRAAPGLSLPGGGAVSVSNGHRGLGDVVVARPVMLVRYRPGVSGETARIVHVVPLPTDGRAVWSVPCVALS